MTPDEYQFQCRRFDNHLVTHDTTAAALGLAAKAGQVADLFERCFRDDRQHTVDRVALKLELGDVMWNVARLASLFQMSLESVMDANINKLVQLFPQDDGPIGPLTEAA